MNRLFISRMIVCFAAVFLFGILSSRAEAVPCTGTHPLLGTTTYVKKTATATSAGIWNAGDLIWWRSVTFSVTKKTTLVESCYATNWDRFWGINGRMKKATPTTVALPGFVRRETKYFCGSFPPTTPLPSSISSIEVLELITPSQPGSTASAMATLAATIDEPGVNLADPATATFADILTDYGNSFLASAPILSDLAAAGLAAQDDPLNPVEPQLDFLVSSFAGTFEDAGLELLSGAPVDPSPFANSGANLLAIATDPAMAVDEVWVRSLPHLIDSAEAMAAMASLVTGGMPDDVAKLAFLDEIESFRLGLQLFSVEFSNGTAVAVPALSILGRLIFVTALVSVAFWALRQKRGALTNP